MSIGFVFGLLAMLGYGTSNAVAKIPSKFLNTSKVIFYGSFVAAGMIYIAMLIQGVEVDFSNEYLLYAVGVGLIGLLALSFFIRGLKTGSVGLVVPIGTSYGLSTSLFAYLFFGHTLNSMQVGAIIALLVGVFLVSGDLSNLRNSSFLKKESGVPFAVLTMIFWGLQLSLIGDVTKHVSPYVVALTFEIVNIVVCGAVLLISRNSDFSLNSGKKVNYSLFIVGLTVGIGTLSSALAYSHMSPGLVAGLVSASPLVSVAIGRLLYKEHLSSQQYLGIVVLLAGVISLSVF